MGEADLSGRRVRAVAASDRTRHRYFVFADGALLTTVAGSVRVERIAPVPQIGEMAHGTGDGRLEGKELELRLYVHEPWVCVSERFGINAALVNTETGSVRPLRRADYHSDVSSYSVGFLEYDGRVLLVAQTAWNRLDIFDAETGDNLTGREVSRRDTGRKDERGSPIYESTNYIDYFHSLLHVSPDSRHFLSNGWVWSPVDVVRVFSTEAFLRGWEPTGASVQGSGYNWDRPCAFVDDSTFVLALDDLGVEGGSLDADERAAYTYHQLAFFSIPRLPSPDGTNQWLEPASLVDCAVFPRNTYGEVKGELHFDAATGCLVALTESDGAHLVSLTGQIVDHLPEISLGEVPDHGDLGSRYGTAPGWAYSSEHRLFYQWRDGHGVAEHNLPDYE